jgi:hypothetical protein
MSKGPHPPPNPPDVTPRDPDIIEDPPPERCWTFRVTDPTQAAAVTSAGAPATGSPHQNRGVLVLVQGEALGFVPPAEAKEMLEALQKGNKRLRGQVLSDGREDPHVLTELCIR